MKLHLLKICFKNNMGRASGQGNRWHESIIAEAGWWADHYTFFTFVHCKFFIIKNFYLNYKCTHTVNTKNGSSKHLFKRHSRNIFKRLEHCLKDLYWILFLTVSYVPQIIKIDSFDFLIWKGATPQNENYILLDFSSVLKAVLCLGTVHIKNDSKVGFYYNQKRC